MKESRRKLDKKILKLQHKRIKKKEIVKEKGITLIALVITIIILLILAGVTLDIALSDNGLFSKTKEAADKYKEASNDELRQLAAIEAATNNSIKEYIDKNNEKVIIPAGLEPTKIEGEDTIKNGLVIVDSDENSYVWVQVPRTKEIYVSATTTLETFTDDDYKKIEADLQNYVKEYRKDNYIDKWYEGCGIEKEEDYNKLKNQMLKSIYENEGFWIGQYEMGTEIPRNSVDDKLESPICKEGKYPYTNIEIANAQKLLNKMEYKDCANSLLFGIQWDLVLKFIETTGKLSKNQLLEDSKDWGNYRSANFNITKGSYKEISNEEQLVDSPTWNKVEGRYEKKYSGVFLTTGATERNSILNIYDLAGNAHEYTLECWCGASSGNFCVIRGGWFFDWKTCACVRNSVIPGGGNPNYGFRNTIFSIR